MFFRLFAQFERCLIQERTQAGLEATRARGKKGGRKKITASNPKVRMAKMMHKNHTMAIDEICKTLKISRSSFYRYLQLPEKGHFYFAQSGHYYIASTILPNGWTNQRK